MTKKESYSDTYNGVAFELVRWGTAQGINQDYVYTDQSPIWNLYLIIHINRIPERHNPQAFNLNRKSYKLGSGNEYFYYDYAEHPVLSNIDFHGGISFGEPIAEGILKVGCDYNHFMDHHSMYSWESLLEDAHTAIDSFLEMIPDYKYRCCGNGKLYDKLEGIIRNNRFCSREYYGKDYPDWFQSQPEGDSND